MTRDRSVPHKRPLIKMLLLVAMHYLTLVGLAAALILLALREDALSAKLVGGALGAAGISWVWCFMKRRNVRCPLCRGTPFLNTGARTHRKATRLFPLNHGSTAMLSSLFTQRFRCMYCGTRYDLLKRHSSRHSQKS